MRAIRILAVGCVALACTDPVVSTQPVAPLLSPDLPTIASAAPQALKERKTSAAEDSLISAVTAKFPGQRGVELRKVLMDPMIDSVTLPAHPDAEVLLHQITAIRSRQKAESEVPLAKPARMLNVQLVLADERVDSSTDVVAVRNADGRDMIVMPKAATAGHLAAGIRALTNLYRRGEMEPNSSARITVKGSDIPKSWKDSGIDRYAESVLQETRSKAPKRVKGFKEDASSLVLPVAIPASP